MKNTQKLKTQRGDAFSNIDINSVWFFEKAETPQFLFISMKINKPVLYKIQQTFTVQWEYNGLIYGCGHFILSTSLDYKIGMQVNMIIVFHMADQTT
jgi:hypothetical protein